jgi:site-specific DNA recombinase
MKKAAIYTRVSTSMQAEKDYNSCEAQKDKIVSYIKSQEDLEFFKEYSDPAYSGGDVERPALKELLRDIRDKKIDVVLTYKIDRLTRSSKDFYALIEFFEKYGVSFVSVTERFDTSSPSGRLLRNIMLTFAQFEREMTVERTRDKMNQRALKGLWNGGFTPFGYKKVNGKLLVDKKDSKLVKEIFEHFALTGSLQKTCDWAKEKGLINPTLHKPFETNRLLTILKHPVYIGKIRWGKKYYDGIHEPLLTKELFDHVQSLFKGKIIKKPLHREYPFKGMISCEECGSSMTPCFTNKKKRRYYYYKCMKVVKEGAGGCSLKEINAERIEPFLFENLSRLAEDRQYLEGLALKKLLESPNRLGYELLNQSSKDLANRVSQVLINLKNSMEKSSQIEKILVLRKTISEIKVSKKYLQVIVSLEDNDISLRGGDPLLESAKMAARTRGAHVNPCAPVCSDQFDTSNGSGGWI